MRLLYWSLHSLASHWRRHPLQLAGLVAGLWLATALLIGVLALGKRLERRQLAALGLSYAGIALAFAHDLREAVFLADISGMPAPIASPSSARARPTSR